jgi:hypothetical protein
MKRGVYTYFDIFKFPFVEKGNKEVNKFAFLFYIVFMHVVLLVVAFVTCAEDYIIRYITPAITALAAEVIIFYFVQGNKDLNIECYNSLFTQLSDTDKKVLGTKFFKWYYDDHLLPMYGFTKQKKEVIKGISIGRKWLPVIGQLAFTIIWLYFAIGFAFQEYHNIWFKIVYVTNSFVYWLIVSYGLRVIIASVFITIHYEKWNPTPPIARFNKSGFDSLTELWNRTIYYFIPFWLLDWIYTALVYKHSLVLDTVYVIPSLFLVCLWSLTTSRRTLLLAKKVRLNAMVKFENIIKEKNDTFINMPSQTALYALQQDIKTVRDYEKTVYSEFTRKPFILSILLNLCVFLLPLTYWVLYFMGILV